MNERLALSVGMCPRGEVGAGVIMISLGYGIKGPILIISVMTLALNLVCTGMFISIVVFLLRREYGDEVKQNIKYNVISFHFRNKATFNKFVK